MTIIERLQQHKDLEPHKMALIVDDIQSIHIVNYMMLFYRSVLII